MKPCLAWWMWVFMSIVGQGCIFDQAELVGQVKSVFGQGVIAQVQVEGLARVVTTQSSGAFRIPYVPGSLELKVWAHGYVTWRKNYNFSTGTRVEIEDVELVPVPADIGLFQVGKSGYEELLAEDLRRPVSLWLGLAEVRRLGTVTSGEATSVCRDRPLIRREAPALGQLYLDVAIRDGRVLRNAEDGGQLLRQELVGEGVWRVTPVKEGSLALVELREHGKKPVAWPLEVKVCTELEVGRGP